MNKRLFNIKKLYESYSNKEGKKYILKESKKLNEGAGAGYNIKGELNDIKITKITNRESYEEGGYGNRKMLLYKFYVEGTAEFDGEASSYYDGADVEGDVIINSVTISQGLFWYEAEDKHLEDYTIDDIVEELGTHDKIESRTIGAGWVHEKFDGDVSSDGDNVWEISFSFKDADVIDFIDKAVQGENKLREYVVYDEEDDAIEYFGEDEKDDAIEFAKKNRGVRVEYRETYYDQANEPIFGNDASVDTVWEREYTRSYKYDESLTEKKCHKELKKKLKESYGVDVIEDLVDRVKANYDGDLEEAVRQAIDDGLIYTEDIFALMDYLGGASEVSDLFFQKYYDALFDELYKTAKERLGVDECIKEEAEEVTDEVEVKKAKKTRGKGQNLWTKVYEEIFLSENQKKSIPVKNGHKLVDHISHYFDPAKKGIDLGDDVGIGVIGAENIGRLEDVANAFKLKIRYGKSGKAAFVILPDEFWDKPYDKYLESKGITL